MQKWEYKRATRGQEPKYGPGGQVDYVWIWYEDGKPIGSVETLLYFNSLGEQGWELSGTLIDTSNVSEFIFKRPKP